MTTARGFIGAGEVFLNVIESGVKLGIAGPFYANKFEVKPNLKKLELVSRARANYGQVLENASVQEPPTFTLELTEASKSTLSAALFGTPTDLSQSAGSIAAEVVVAKLGFWVPLTKGGLTGPQTVTNTGVSLAYTQDQDFEINTQMGWIKALTGGAIANNQSIKVSSTYGAYTGTKITGATKTDIRAEIIFVGINMVDQSPCIVRIWEGIIAPDAALDFLGDNFYATPLPGTMRTPTGQSEPFTVELRTA